MNIILSGYGRMGKEIEKICKKRKHKIIAIINTNSEWENLLTIDYSNAVVIDFSLPDEAINIYNRCFKLGLPVVTGTTGWYNSLSNVSKQCNLNKGTFFYAPNFSVGVNLFFKANNYLAKLMCGFNNYNVRVNEIHHIHKLDAPSGTAISIGEGIISEYKNINTWVLDKDDEINSLPIFSFRKGEVTGTHEVVYESDEDKLIFKHEAKNRSGFALGAVLAAEFVSGKSGVFNMDDLLKGATNFNT